MFETKFTEKFEDYTLSSDSFVNDYITEVDSYDLSPYLLNDILKLLEKSILNKLSADLLFQKNYWSWGFVTIYYSNFYMVQVLNRIAGNFFMFKSKNFNKNITYDKLNNLYAVPPQNNGETSHLREFKKLKDNFAYIKTWDDDKLQELLQIINVENKDILFKYTIDNDIKESEIRNEINYRLKEYQEIEYNNRKNILYRKIYNKIINNNFCLFKDDRAFNLIQINQKRFLFLSIFIKEIKEINPSFKIKLTRMGQKLEEKYDNEFHSVNLDIKESIKGLYL